jgi:hypothetical protein
MKRLLPLLFVLLVGACSQKVDVRAGCYPLVQDPVGGRYFVYGVETLSVTCSPVRDVGYTELRVDSVLVHTDTFPGMVSCVYEWDVTKLPEAGMHVLQGKAISGSREYLSSEFQVMVGFRSQFAVKGSSLERTLGVFWPDGTLVGGLTFDAATPSCPRLGRGCQSIFFIADHELYRRVAGAEEPELLAHIANGIYSCDASPVSDLVVVSGYPAAVSHLFLVDSVRNKTQLTHDSDFVIIDSSRFTCIENSSPVFSPDGRKIAYFRKSKCLVDGDPHEDEIREDAFVMNADGTNPVILTESLNDHDFSSFTWTFDGKWVLFRVGASHAAHGVCAATLSGHVITGLLVPTAVACSPVDSSLIYINHSYGDRPLFWKKLSWTNDTIFADSAGLPVGNGAAAYSDHIDWARYRPQ